MNNIISLIASYNPTNPYVRLVIEELNKFSDVILFTTEHHTYPVHETLYFDKSIEANLVYEPRKWILSNLDKSWDYVLYNEDDILIPMSTIQSTLDLYQTLPNNMIPGFARCEYLDDDVKRFIDLHPKHSIHRGGDSIIKEVFELYNVWEPWNLHSGNYFLSKNHVNQLINSNEFLDNYTPFNTYGFLETAASSVYQNLHKVISKDINSSICYHLPNKYIPLQGGPTIDDINIEYNQKIKQI